MVNYCSKKEVIIIGCPVTQQVKHFVNSSSVPVNELLDSQ